MTVGGNAAVRASSTREVKVRIACRAGGLATARAQSAQGFLYHLLGEAHGATLACARSERGAFSSHGVDPTWSTPILGVSFLTDDESGRRRPVRRSHAGGSRTRHRRSKGRAVRRGREHRPTPLA